jgi:UDP-N-acetylglucosamine--N-acetylmuramyl-(pentapeptide) pyrophosphoryl-undecaprenol N-acetylglucosamine transferase
VINKEVARWAADFLRVGQLIHVCGRNDEAWLRAGHDMLAPQEQQRYLLKPYLHDDIADAFAAADLAVMRAGASTLGELPAARLPAVLIPGDFSNQVDNARYLERHAAAVTLPQPRIEELKPLVLDLMSNDARRASMRTALASLARPDAAERLADLVVEVATHGRGKAA